MSIKKLDIENKAIRNEIDKVNTLIAIELKKAPFSEKIHYYYLHYRHTLIMKIKKLKRGPKKSYSFAF